jgi:hypothetical protein
VYHPKMRKVDVEALELYRHLLLERQRQRQHCLAVQQARPIRTNTDVFQSVSDSILRVAPSGILSYWPSAF